MKKLFVSIAITLFLVTCLLLTSSDLLLNYPFGQKIFLKLEGDQVAEFYFPEGNMSRDTVYMRGVIYSNTLDDIKRTLSNNPSITTLVMEDVPGSIDDAINLLASREIRKRGVNTYIPEDGMVASGGTDMFLAGKQRAVHPSARIGVHSWSGGDSVALDFPKNHIEHVKYLNYYREMDIPQDFYWYTLAAAPADDIHWMTPDEMNKYRVVKDTSLAMELLEIQEKLSSDSFKGRATGDNEEAQDLIRSYFEEHGLAGFNKSYDDPFTFKDEKTNEERKGNNIISYVKGDKYPDQYIVIGAHYDHLGIINDTIYNGADDNASGTSALLILAKHFRNNIPDHSIIFAAFDAEELGLHGSRHFINKSPILVSSIILNINLDMISRNPNHEIYAVGTYEYPQFKTLIEATAATSLLKVSYGHDDPHDKTKDYWMRSSDNAPFFTANIPNITFSEEDHPGYHHPTDDFENINPDFFQNVVLFIQNTIESIDKNFPDSSN